MAFDGRLLLLGGEEFPMKYIYADSYKISPNKAMDLESTRDANGVLQRNVVDHTATNISFEVRPMYEDMAAEMWAFIRSKFISAKEKKLRITYFNPFTNSYDSGDFYMPDIEPTIYMIDVPHKRITFNTYTMEFIEY